MSLEEIIANGAGGVLAVSTAIVAVGYGCYRAMAFSPVWRSDYRAWLSQTPWTSDKPLPLGPIHTVWQDLLILFVLELLGLHSRLLPIGSAVFGFLIPHGFLTAIAFRMTGILRHCYGFLLVLGLVVMLWPFPLLHAATGIVLYGVVYKGIRPMLRRVREPAMEATIKAVFAYLSGGVRAVQKSVAAEAGWPYGRLKQDSSFLGIRTSEAWVLALLAGWCMFVPLGLAYNSGEMPNTAKELQELHGFLSTLCAIVIVGCTIMRCVTYIAGYVPPISLLGRVLTGRLVIPGYDRVVVTPLVAAGSGFLLWLPLGAFGLPAVLGYPVSLIVFFAVLLNGGPTLRNWRLTGRHRMVPPLDHRNRAQYVKT